MTHFEHPRWPVRHRPKITAHDLGAKVTLGRLLYDVAQDFKAGEACRRYDEERDARAVAKWEAEQ